MSPTKTRRDFMSGRASYVGSMAPDHGDRMVYDCDGDLYICDRSPDSPAICLVPETETVNTKLLEACEATVFVWNRSRDLFYQRHNLPRPDNESMPTHVAMCATAIADAKKARDAK